MVVSLGATKQEETKISLSGAKSPKYPAEYINEVGTKYSLGMGDVSPGATTMSQAVYTGTEDRYRYLMASAQTTKDENVKLGLINDIATQRGGQATADDIEIVKGLTQPDLYSKDLPTILEQAYAKRATEYAATVMDEDTGVLSESMSTNMDASLEMLDRAEWSVARKFLLDNKIQSILSRSEFRGVQDVPAHAWAWAQQLVPFWQDFNIGNAVPDSKPDSMFVGDNLMKAVNYMWGLTPVEFKKELDRVESNFMGRGDFLGYQRFLNSLSMYSESDKAMDNIWQGIDVATALPVAKLASALKSGTRAANIVVRDIEQASVRVGKNAAAARAKTMEALGKNTLPTTNIKHLSDIENSIPSTSRPHQTWTGKPKMTPASLQRYEKAMMQQDELVSRAFSEPVRVDRLDPNQVSASFARAETELNEMFYHDKYSIVDLVRNEADNENNFNTVTARFGLKNGDYFQSEKQAQNNAKWIGLKTDSYEIKPVDGGKWTVEVNRPVREDDLRTVEIETTHKSPKNWQNRFLDFIRTPDDKVSKAQVVERSAVVYGQEHMAQIISELAKPFSKGAINKRELGELERVFDYQRVPDKMTRQGTLFHRVEDLEEYFHDTFNHLPSEAQIEAYSAYVKLNDLDWTIRNQDIYVQKLRMGIEEITFKMDGIDFAVPLEGRVLDSLPSPNVLSRSNYKAAVVQNGKVSKTFSSRFPNLKAKEQIDELIADGYKVVQVSGSFKVGEQRFQYLVMRDFKRNNLSPKQLAYNPGHRIDKFGHYLKQAKVNVDEDGITQYYGDRGFANVRSEQEGIELANRFNIAREKIRTAAPDADVYVRDNLPITMERLRKDIDNGFFDLNQPIHYVRAGQSTRSKLAVADLGKFDDLTDYEHNPAGRITGKFIGQKDEFELPTYMVEKEVAHTFQGATKLSPLEALRVGVNNAVQVRIVNDYRVKSAEDFVREFGGLLDADSEALRTGSIEFLYEPKYHKDADPTLVSRAESVRKTIVELLNYKTYVEKAVDIHKERLVNSIRSGLGSGVADFVQDSLLPKIANADRWLRAAAFHSKLGLFNPKQLFLQASAAVNAVAIAGPSGLRAMTNISHMLLAARFTDNPAKLAAIAKYTNMRPEHFVEMMNAFKRSGFSKVKGDVSALDLAAGPNIRSGRLNQVLDLGATPFNSGEFFSRSMAWNAAYDEWRTANKTGVLNRQAEKSILARAQLLSGNMTRQSNARWQKGYLSVVTQFFGAQARLTEQMLSGGLFGNGRLTRAEKARLFLGMSAMYGLPVGAGMTVGVLPVRDMLRDWLAENQVAYDDTLAEPFIDGFAATFMEFATGGDFTVSEKYGLGGIPTLWDLMKEDSTLTDLLLGASGGIILDTMSNTVPMWKYIGSVVDLDDDTYYQITPSELMDPLRNITTVNAAVRLWEAANVQKWMSRNGTVLTDITEGEAWISSVFGVDPERVSDAYNKADAVANWNAHDRSKRKEITVSLTRAIQAFRSGNEDVGDTLIDRSRKEAIRLGLTNREFAQLLSNAVQEEGFDDIIAETFTKKALERAKRTKE